MIHLLHDPIPLNNQILVLKNALVERFGYEETEVNKMHQLHLAYLMQTQKKWPSVLYQTPL